MSGSFLTGLPREANQGGKEGDFFALERLDDEQQHRQDNDQ
jgi:hypothetical protein